jgi:hypothetical protein
MMHTREFHETAIVEGFPLLMRTLGMEDGVTTGALLREVYRGGAHEYDVMREALEGLCGMKPGHEPTEQQVDAAFDAWTDDAPRRIECLGVRSGQKLWAIGPARQVGR